MSILAAKRCGTGHGDRRTSNGGGQDMSAQAESVEPSIGPRPSEVGNEPILEVDGLRKFFASRSALDRLARRPGTGTLALDDVSLSLPARQALAIVGESGSGKTTLAHSLVRLVEPDAGSVMFCGKDILKASRSELPGIRRRIQLIYQDPYTSLNSAMKIGDAIIEPALVHRLVDKQAARGRLQELMEQVGLNANLADRRPRALSGGQRQRVAIARSLAAEPEILVADEAVSALDVSVQAQVIRLFARLQAELGLTLIFVSHQLAIVTQLCEQVAIMYRGRLVEIGPTAEVFARPRHGYTATLIGAHPGGRRLRDRTHANNGTAPAPAPDVTQPGCPFRHRCRFAVEICATDTPPPLQITPDHMARCHILPHDTQLAAGAGVKALKAGKLGPQALTG
jgi:peptide/nickel transport system ATP-binding protein/oligopeptide transport system ATP-binding protein